MKKIILVGILLVLLTVKLSAQKPMSDIAKTEMINTAPSYVAGFIKAANKVAEVKAVFTLATSGAVTKAKALDSYNETLGDNLGKAKTYDEAVKLVDTKAYSYMHIMGLKTFGEALKERAKEMTN